MDNLNDIDYLPEKLKKFLIKIFCSDKRFFLLKIDKNGIIIDSIGDFSICDFNKLDGENLFKLMPEIKSIMDNGEGGNIFFAGYECKKNVKVNLYIVNDNDIIYILFLESILEKFIKNNEKILKNYLKKVVNSKASELKHDFKTPIYTIKGIIDILKDMRIEGVDDKIEIISDSISHLNFLVDNFFNNLIGNNYDEKELLLASEDKENELNKFDYNILLFEDNTSHIIIFKEIAKNYGLYPDVAQTTLEFRDCIKEKKYDIIFLDLRIPNLKSEDFKKVIVYIKQVYNSYLVGLSAYINDKEISDFKRCGLDDFISKPITKEKFFECITKYKNFYNKYIITEDILDYVRENKADIYNIFMDLKENINLFDYNRVVELSNQLLKFDKYEIFTDLSNQLKEIAEDFDDIKLEKFVNYWTGVLKL